MVPKLYMVWGSPPVNAVLMAARVLNVELDLHEIDFPNQEYLMDWFLKLNPSHTVPTLDDNGLIIWDSHAILVYLAETYGKDSTLYSSDAKEKFSILQILNLDCGTVFRRISDCIKPLFYDSQDSINSKHLENMKEMYSILERILSSTTFLAGDHLTIADISVFSSVIVGNLFLPVEQATYPKLKKWLIDIQSLDLFKAGEKGVERMIVALKSKIHI